jgi:hypothetical protein
LPDEGWDMIISPAQSARPAGRLGATATVMLFVRRDFVSVYKQTILGPLWYLIQPLLTTLTFTVIFGRIASLPTDGLPPFLFYMSGTVIWSYFADCLNKTSNTFVGNAALFGKVYFPRMAVPVSILFSSLITFLIQFAMFLGFVVFMPVARPSAELGMDRVLACPDPDDGRAGPGFRGHHLLADHQVSRPALPGHLWRLAVDVRHAGDLPDLVRAAAVPVDPVRQPDDLDRGGVPLRFSGRGFGERAAAAVQFLFYAGVGVPGERYLQPRGADFYGYGVGELKILNTRVIIFYHEGQ